VQSHRQARASQRSTAVDTSGEGRAATSSHRAGYRLDSAGEEETWLTEELRGIRVAWTLA